MKILYISMFVMLIGIASFGQSYILQDQFRIKTMHKDSLNVSKKVFGKLFKDTINNNNRIVLFNDSLYIEPIDTIVSTKSNLTLKIPINSQGQKLDSVNVIYSSKTFKLIKSIFDIFKSNNQIISAERINLRICVNHRPKHSCSISSLQGCKNNCIF